MKNYIYSLFVLLLGCSANKHSLCYEIYSTGADTTMTPTTGYVKLDIHSVGDFSLGYIDINTDSLTVKDSVVCSNYERGGKEFLDVSLRTSGHRLIMYDNNWGLFKKESDKAIIFYESKSKSWFKR
jgi:hypothetical protein